MLRARLTHAWDLSEDEAVRLQDELAAQVVTEDRLPDPIAYVAGMDVAYDTTSDRLCAGVVVLEAATLEVVATATAQAEARYPYVPGRFSFRELPPLCQALEKLVPAPDLVVCDGQGLAHPRRFGLACHLGVLYDLPAIGCGKTRLIGEYEEPGRRRGEYERLVDKCETVGRVLRTQDGVKPVFVSVGHRVSLDTACAWVLRLAPRYRLPETTRWANHLVNQMRRAT
jgi:deoxyribonuclease V